MSLSSMKKFMEDNHFTADMLTAEEKIYVEIFDALVGAGSREEYIQAKEKYKEQFPIFSKVNCEANGYFHGPETSEFVKALVQYLPSVSDNLSKYDGELYFDKLHDEIKHKYTDNAEWTEKLQTMTLADMNALPYKPKADIQQLKDLDRFLDEVNVATEALFSKSDEKYHNGKALRNADTTSIYSVLIFAIEKEDKALYRDAYNAVTGLEKKFHGIKDWDKLQFPLLNCTPSRNPLYPIELKDNYFFSSIIMQAPIYKTFKRGTGLTLANVAKKPNYLTEEKAKGLIGMNLERVLKENPGTPAHDKEAFDFVMSSNEGILLAYGLGGPLVSSTLGLSLVINLDKNIDSPEAMLKQDASDIVVSNSLKKMVDDAAKVPLYKKLEALVKVANPMENWQVAFGLTKAPAAKGEQINKGAQTLVNLVQESHTTVNAKQEMMIGLERGLRAAYKENTWFLQRWLNIGDAKRYTSTINDVRGKRMALSAPVTAENKANKPDEAKKKVDLGISTDKKKLSPDPVRKEAPAVTKNVDVKAPK